MDHIGLLGSVIPALMRGPPGIEHSRIVLLHDAVWPQMDRLYLGPSYVHAPMWQQHQESLRSTRPLSAGCRRYLDDLVCWNTMASPELPTWLAELPTPLRDVLADAALSSAYSTYVNAVASFSSPAACQVGHTVGPVFSAVNQGLATG